MSATYKTRIPAITREIPQRIDAAVKTTAELIEERAKSRVPVGVFAPHLKDDIHVERMGPAEHAVVAGRGDTFYGHIIEHGSIYHAPHPFLVPALEESRDEGYALGKRALKGIE